MATFKMTSETKALTLVLSLLVFAAAHAKTNTLYVAEGATLTVDQVVAASNFTFAAGDWIRKTGKGQLNAVTTHSSTQLNILIEEGVYFVPWNGTTAVHSQSGTLVIKSGATLMLQNVPSFSGTWNVSFEGSGTGEGDNLGAICVRANTANYILGTAGTWTMTGDATIYTTKTTSGTPLNSVLSGGDGSAGPTLDMQGHALTIRGAINTSIFRPRNKLVVRNSGPIFVRNEIFARHASTNDIEPNIPLVSFAEGASMDTYSTSSIWGNVDAFEFEAGTTLKKSTYGASNVTLTMKKATGPVDISSDATVTISKEFGVRGTDMANGDKLTSANALTFSDGCKLSVTNWGGVLLSPGSVYTVASSATGIFGTPELTGDAAAVFTVANTGTALTLTVKPGFIDVVEDWGVQTGSGNAAANAAAVASHVGDVTDGAIIYFPEGEYWFTDAFDLSSVAATGLTIMNFENAVVLRSGINVGAASDVTVKGLVFKECAGPAVVATGTSGLTIRDCKVENVVGAYAGGRYPFAAVNVTGFYLKDCKWSATGFAWDGQGYFDGGTQNPLSEAYAGAVVVKAVSGDWLRWDVTNTMGLAATAYGGKVLRKVGIGALDPNSAGVQSAGISAIEVLEGRYVSRADSHLGVAKGPVHVCAGACLTLVGGSGQIAANRTITISGTGESAEFPAVRFAGTAWWETATSVTWVLEDDATMYSAVSGSNGTFLTGTIRMNGHHLSLNGISGSHYRFGRTFNWYGGGTATVSRATLSASTPLSPGYRIMDDLVPKFVFTNEAKFVPDDASICNLVKDCDFVYGTSVEPANSCSLVFDNLAGTPSFSAKATAVTVNGMYTARTADAIAGRLGAIAGSLVFSAGATVEIDDPTITMGRYDVLVASGGITGSPKTSGDTKTAGWSCWMNGSTTLGIGPRPGFVLILR